jgi:hypothetical protein
MDARVQASRPDNPADASVADLFHQLVDDGRSLVGAEVNLYKQIAAYRASKAKNGIAALAAALFLLNAALVAFFVSLVMGLDNFLGPIGAGLVVLAVTGIIGFLLVRYGAGKLAVLGGDQEEKAALAAGEKRA